MSTPTDTQTGAAVAPGCDPDVEGASAAQKRRRKTLDDQIAETQAALAKLVEAKRDQDRAEREANARKIASLLKSMKLDRFSVEAWTSSAEAIRAILAKAQGSDPSAAQD